MLVKTSELTGRALDWAVATALGLTIDNLMGGAVWAWSKDALTDEDETIIIFSPTMDWAQGGPLIDREMRNGLHLHGGTYAGAAYYRESYGGFDKEYYGPTALIAVCRCFVASRLGDTVDIPEELHHGH